MSSRIAIALWIAVLAAIGRAQQVSTLLPYASSGYRYKTYPTVAQVPADVQSPSFDDSSWAIGCAPFHNSGCSISGCTSWSGGNALVLRRSFDSIDPGALVFSGAELGFSIDNDVHAWINGVDVTGYIATGNCPFQNKVVTGFLPGLLTPTGNLLVAMAYDYGGTATIDAEVRVTTSPLAADPGVIGELFSRESSVHFAAVDPLPRDSVTEVFSRELSVHYAELPRIAPAVIEELLSRELSVHYGNQPRIDPSSIAEVYSREFSAHFEASGQTASGVLEEVFSRELSAHFSPIDSGIPGVVGELFTRELTAHYSPVDSGLPGLIREVFSRELSVHAPTADLRPIELVAPTNGTAGQPITVTWQDKSEGVKSAKGPWTDQLYLSSNGVAGDADDTLLGASLPVPSGTSLAPGTSLARTHTVAIPVSYAGSYYLALRVDSHNDVLEDEEADNVVASLLPINIAPEPVADLRVVAIDAPAFGYDGEPLAISWTVTNQGTLDIPANGMWSDQVLLTQDQVVGNGDDIALTPPGNHSGGLAIGASYTLNLSPQVPFGLNGDWFVAIRTDVGGSILEKNGGENNNTTIAAAPTLIQQENLPDLAVIEFGAPSPKFTGESVALSWKVQNTATPSSQGYANGQWTDQVWVSTDASFDPLVDAKVAGASATLTYNKTSPLGPGSFYVRTATIKLPSTAGTWHYFVRTDDGEKILEEGNGSNNVLGLAIVVEAPSYTAIAQTAIGEALAPLKPGDTLVPISGQALDITSGAPVPNVPVTVRIWVKGTKRVFPVTTDATGSFSLSFLPVPDEAGSYKLYADHPAVPGENLEQPQDQFALKGLRVSPAHLVTNVKEAATESKSVTLRNLGDLAIGDISSTVQGGTEFLKVNEVQVPSTIAGSPGGGVTAPITYELQSLALPQVPGTPAVIDTDIFVPIEGVATKATSSKVTAYVSPLVPSLAVTPGGLGTAAAPFEMLKGKSKVVPIQVKNLGEGAATNLHVSISCSGIAGGCEWLGLVTPEHLPDLGPGEEAAVELSLQPPLTLTTDQLYGGNVLISFDESAVPKAMPFVFRATTDQVGSVLVAVEDELTYYGAGGNPQTGGGPRVANATVKLFDAVSGALRHQGFTDGSGEVGFAGVVEGFYKLHAEAEKHSSFEKLIQVQPGQQAPTSVFLQSQKVSYEWTVVPVDFKDVYDIVITAVFETFVPVPVVTVEAYDTQGTQLSWPLSLDMAAGETKQVNFKIKNHGLIAAKGVELVLGNPAGYVITPIATQFGDLGPQDEIDVPTTIHKLQPPPGVAPSDCDVTFTAGVRWYLICINEKWYWVPIYFKYSTYNCPSAPVGGGCPPGGCGGGGGGGGPTDPYFPPPTVTTDVTCQPPPLQADEGPPPCDSDVQCCSPTSGGAGASGAAGGSGSGSQPAGNFSTGYPGPETHPVNLFSGEETLTEIDLRIPGRGFDFVWARRYRSKIGPDTVQGNGWDFLQNARIDRLGANVVYFNGLGRADLFEPDTQPNTWTQDEHFIEIQRLGDGTYRVDLPDLTHLDFHPVSSSSPISGKLKARVDRFGNSIQYIYDGAGRLTQVLDTLNRPIDLAYYEATSSTAGYLKSVRDFSGREIVYTYYTGAAGEPGSLGDLASVRTPVVTGTPNGNDFPAGKSRFYTYTRGFADERLNHNLVSVIDGKGQTTVTNTYSQTLLDTDRDFDRVVRQVWGDQGSPADPAGDVIDLVYVPTVPTIKNNESVLTTIVNDRMGNVSEYDWDIRNRLIAVREYTGRANPDLPTTVFVNRPTNKLRSTDPDFFETRFGYNNDSMLTRVTHPTGTIEEYVYEADISPSVAHKVRGNLRIARRLQGTHTPHSEQPKLEELYEYLDGAGACCGTNFVTRHTDADGHATEHVYDASANRIQTIHPIQGIVEDWEYNEFGQVVAHVLPRNGKGTGTRRRDEYVYYPEGSMRGYLQAEIVDADGFGMTTTYEYDPVGHLTRAIDPRGNDTLYTVNALGQVVRERSRPVQVLDAASQDFVDFAAAPVRYEKLYWYDANDNLVRSDVQAVDEYGQVDSNAYLTTLYEHEVLDRLTRTCQEVGNASLANDDLSCADIPDLDQWIVTEFDHDANGNPTLLRKGEATKGTQPLNTVTTLYDERDLPWRIVRADDGDPGSSSGPESNDQRDYDGNGNLVATRTGLGAGTTFRVWEDVYDGYDRVVQKRDPMGNFSEHEYDANGNEIERRFMGELHDLPGGANNVLMAKTAFQYDALDRLVRQDRSFFDPATGKDYEDGLQTTLTEWTDASDIYRTIDDRGAITTQAYDSANRLLEVVDAGGNKVQHGYDPNSNEVTRTEIEVATADGSTTTYVTSMVYDGQDRMIETIDPIGRSLYSFYDSRGNLKRTYDGLLNQITYEYDGLDRELAKHYRMTVDGTGAGQDDPLNPEIVLRQGWDASSRLVRHTDDLGKTTTYAYDPLDRTVQVTRADRSGSQYTYDAHDDKINAIDPNGSLLSSHYDALGRVEHRTCKPGGDVSNTTTFESVNYDGESHIIATGNDLVTTLRRYDSLGYFRSDVQGQVAVTVGYDSVGNRLQTVYPSGKIVHRSFDALRRIDSTSDQSGMIAAYEYVGPSRIATQVLGNGTTASYLYDVARRTLSICHREGSGALIDCLNYVWSPADTLVSSTESASGITTSAVYDSIYRLRAATRQDALSGSSQTTEYVLDGAGNRVTVTENGTPTPYVCNGADCDVHQYSSVGSEHRTYTARGELASVSSSIINQSRQYDAHGRVVEFRDNMTGDQLESVYDVAGRSTERIQKSLGVVHSRRVWLGSRVLELNSNNNVLDYVIDAIGPVCIDVAGQKYYRHCDMLGSAVALSDQSGHLVEKYSYGDFGETRIMDPLGFLRTASAYGNMYLYAGEEYVQEAKLIDYVARWLSPAIGRFESTDPLGGWSDVQAIGVSTTYAGNRPLDWRDAYGLQATPVNKPVPMPAPTPTLGPGAGAPTYVPPGVGSGIDGGPPEIRPSIRRGVACLYSGGGWPLLLSVNKELKRNGEHGWAWFHCYTNCEMTKACGKCTAKSISDQHEDEQVAVCKRTGNKGYCWSAKQKADKFINRAGRQLGSQGMECRSACTQLVGGRYINEEERSSSPDCVNSTKPSCYHPGGCYPDPNSPNCGSW